MTEDATGPTVAAAPEATLAAASGAPASAVPARAAVPTPPRAWASALVWFLRVLGAAAMAACILAILVLQDEPRLLRWEVPAAAVYGLLAAAGVAALANLAVPRAALHLAGLALLAAAASGLRDLSPADPALALLLAAFLLAAELPDGAARFARLHAAIPVSRKSQAGRDLRLHGLHYALIAPLTLLLLAGAAVLALRAPELAMDALGLKYQEALETRSVFFVVAVCWLLIVPILLARALLGLRRAPTAEAKRPPSPVATGALTVDATAASSNNQPLIEVTQ